MQGDGIEEVEESVNVALDAQLPAAPLGDRVPRPQVLHLEPVFNVKAEAVADFHMNYFLTVSHVTIFCPFNVFQKATMEAAFTTQKYSGMAR